MAPCPRPPSAVCDRGHAASVATPSERERSSVALDLVRCAPGGAPAGYSLPNDALDRDDHEICPSSLQSEKRTQRPKLVAIAESPLRCDSAECGPVLFPPRSARRLRRPRRYCYGPLLRPAIRRNLARAGARHLTTSRGPRDEVLRNSGAPTVGSGWRK